MAESNVDGEEPPKITFADLGIPQAPQLELNNVTGAARKLSDVSTKEKLYIVLMLLGVASLLSLTIYRLTVIDSDDSDFAFCLVLIVNSLFSVFYIFDSIKRERPSELIVLSTAVTLMVIYLVVNYASGKKDDIKLARMIAGCVLAVPLVLFGLYLSRKYHAENHLIFRIVGANTHLQSLLTRLYCFQDLLKFDFELQLSLIILVFGSRDSFDSKDIIIVSVGAPLTIAWFFIGYFGFPRENKASVMVFYPLCLPGIGYMIYKMYDLSKYIDAHPGLAAATIACGVIGLFVRVMVMMLGALVYRGFGSGLKDDIQPIAQNEA